MKNNLAKTGLSLSQAASISNLCNQRAQEINNTLTGINNATKSFMTGGDKYILEVGKPIPSNVVELLIEKGQLHATQAFLMTNIKAKDEMLQEIRQQSFVSEKHAPERPKEVEFKPQPLVNENWGWDQLSNGEYAEYLEQESYASHIGQFIHKNSPLDSLRKALPSIKALDFIELETGKKTPVKVEAHHTSEDLLKYHEVLAGKHRDYEMRCNYFKAKVKNLVTEENARISKENAINGAEIVLTNEKIRQEWLQQYKKHADALQVELEEFESTRQAAIQGTAALRISIDPRFQKTIDLFLKDLGPES